MRFGNGLFRAVVCGWLTGATLFATDTAIGRSRGGASGGNGNSGNPSAAPQNAGNPSARRLRRPEAPNAVNPQNRFAGPGAGVPPYPAPYRAPYQAPYANPYGRPYQSAYGAPGNYPAMNYGGNYVRPSAVAPPAPVTRAIPPAPQPAAASRAASPARAATTPTPAAPPSYRETAAAHLYAQARAATWDLYENYCDNETYASTYRSMRGLLETVKSISTRIRKEASDTSARPSLAVSLQEADAMLQVLQAEIANWQPDSQNKRKPSDPELQTRLERMSATLADLMSAVAVPTTNLAALDEGPATTIRSKQSPEPQPSGPRLAPTPIDNSDPPGPTPALPPVPTPAK